MADAPPTLQDLEAARADLARQIDRQERYDGNNRASSPPTCARRTKRSPT